jgi:hypothetical protein
MTMMSTDPLVIFTPSGKRGRFPRRHAVLTAARQLGVDLDSVCGGRGICSKCQVTPSYGDFPKHGVTVARPTRCRSGTRSRSAMTVRGLKRAAASAARRRFRATSSSTCRPKARCTGRSCARPPRPAPSPWTRPRALLVEVRSPTCTNPPAIWSGWRGAGRAMGDHRRDRATPSCKSCNRCCARASWQVSVALHSPPGDTRTRSSASGPACTRAGFTGLAIDLGSTTIAAHLCDLRRARAGLGGHHEPADPLRRRPDEPGQLRDDEPRRRPRR